MSDYLILNHIKTSFDKSSINSFVILSEIERSIKEKIEKVGTPLKDWDIQINYGIKTGFNEAFIIDGKTKDELISKSPKNAEIIRPILRGRDIKRYGYEFADKWLICTHNGTANSPAIKIDDYPEIKEHLDQYYMQLSSRQDKGVTPYHLRSCAYMDDFSKQKIVWLELTDKPSFYMDSQDFFMEATTFFMIGDKLEYLLAFLNSNLCEWYFDKICATSGTGTRRWKKVYLELIPIPKVDNILFNLFKEKVELSQEFRQNNHGINPDIFKEIEEEILRLFDFTRQEINHLSSLYN